VRILLVLVVLTVGCGESKSRTRPICDKIRDVCGADAVDDCPSDRDLAEAEKRVGKRAVDNYLACVRAADSCMHVVGCVGGLGMDAIGEVERGFERSGHGGRGDPTVRYVDVAAVWAPDPVGDHELAVTIEVEATSEIGHRSPFVKVESRCDGRTDEEDAFFMELSGLRTGGRRVDTVKLHGADRFAQPARQCELTLTLVRGATDSTRFCFDGKRVRPGRC
jgi:hypothetical protein